MLASLQPTTFRVVEQSAGAPGSRAGGIQAGPPGLAAVCSLTLFPVCIDETLRKERAFEFTKKFILESHYLHHPHGFAFSS